MAVPKVDKILGPFVKLLASCREYTLKDMTEDIGIHFELSEKDQAALIPSGGETVLRNRVGWARTYLKKAGLIESPRRGWICLTEKGKHAASTQKTIDIRYLESIPEFQEFRQQRRVEKKNEHKQPLSDVFEAGKVSLSQDPDKKRIYFRFSSDSAELRVGLPCSEDASIEQAWRLSEALHELVN